MKCPEGTKAVWEYKGFVKGSEAVKKRKEYTKKKVYQMLISSWVTGLQCKMRSDGVNALNVITGKIYLAVNSKWREWQVGGIYHFTCFVNKKITLYLAKECRRKSEVYQKGLGEWLEIKLMGLTLEMIRKKGFNGMLVLLGDPSFEVHSPGEV